MNSPGCLRKYVVRWEWYLTGAAESEKKIVCLLLCAMEKAVDLRDFDRSQIGIVQRLGTNISKTARLVGCSLSTVVSTYAK